METHTSAPRPGDAREALRSAEQARRRLAMVSPPRWLHWSLVVCVVVEGLAQLLVGWERLVLQALVLVAIFALSFAAQRSSGVVTRVMRPPGRPPAWWVAFGMIVIGAALLTSAAGPLGCFALAALIVVATPRLQALFRRLA